MDAPPITTARRAWKSGKSKTVARPVSMPSNCVRPPSKKDVIVGSPSATSPTSLIFQPRCEPNRFQRLRQPSHIPRPMPASIAPASLLRSVIGTKRVCCAIRFCTALFQQPRLVTSTDLDWGLRLNWMALPSRFVSELILQTPKDRGALQIIRRPTLS